MRDSELAQRAEVRQQRIWDVTNGRLHRFAPEAARRIAQATGGAVTFEDLMLWRWPEIRRPRRRGTA